MDIRPFLIAQSIPRQSSVKDEPEVVRKLFQTSDTRITFTIANAALSSVVLKQQLGSVFEASNVDWLVDSRFGEESIDKELKLSQYFDTEWIVEGFPIEVKANTTVVGRANTWYFAYGAYRNCNSSA